MKKENLRRRPFATAVCLLIASGSLIAANPGCSSKSDDAAPVAAAEAGAEAAVVPEAAAEDVIGSDGGCDTEPTGVKTTVSLPVPGGSFGVARTGHHTLVDPIRDEPDTTDAADKRKLSIEIWYPTDRCAAGEEAPVADVAEAKFLLVSNKDWWKEVRTHVKLGVPMIDDGKRHPVLLFSSGFGGTPHAYTALISSVVSRGFVVVAISHSFWDGITTFEDGSSARSAHAPTLFLDPDAIVWRADQSLVLDSLAALDANSALPVAGRLDLDKVGSFGHSFGGSTAITLAARDSRLKAALDVDGTIFDAPLDVPDAGDAGPFDAGNDVDASPSLPAIAAPIFIFRSDRPEDDSFVAARARATGPAYELVLAKSGHGSCSEGALVVAGFGLPANPQADGTIDPRRALAVFDTYVSAFFTKHLMGDAAPILAGPSPDFPEVTFVAP